MDRQEHRRPYWREEEDSVEAEEFAAAHRSFSDRLERFLMQLIILALAGLTLVQTLHTNTTARRMLNLVEGLEGVPWEQVASWTGQRPLVLPAAGQAEELMLTVVSLSRRSAPEVRLLIDGMPAGSFGAGSLTVSVRPGQVVSIDGSGTRVPLSFRVVGPPGLVSPALGASVTTQGNVQELGVVKAGGR